MLFDSLEFCLLLFVTFILYYLPAFKRFQAGILIFSSFFFYYLLDQSLFLVFLSSVLLNSLSAYLITSRKVKGFALYVVVLNILLLVYFKYNGYFISFFELETIILLPLPIGISFYTFQGISLVVDSYFGKDRDSQSHSVKESLLFLSFFPQVVAGPILQSSDFIPQIGVKQLNTIKWSKVIHYLILGYYLKLVIADNLSYVSEMSAYPLFIEYSSTSLILIQIAYCFQLFADFCGYSFIALGLAELFGYKIIRNFEYPFIAASFAEFWKRWHISLSLWMKKYLYIPLGGNRAQRFRVIFNVLLVFLLSGLWHGATANFAIWGIIHAFLLILEKYAFRAFFDSTNRRAIKVVIVFVSVVFAFIFFRFDELEHAFAYLGAIELNPALYYSRMKIESFAIWYSVPVLLMHIYALYRSRFQVVMSQLKYVVYAYMVFMIVFDRGVAGQFIYFQF